MIQKIKKIWKDPVGSKLIAGGIMTILPVIYLTMLSLVNDESFIENAKRIFNIKVTILNIIYILIGIILIWIIIILIKKHLQKEKFEYNESHRVLDFELYNRIKDELLPANGSIAFIREYNFAGFAFRNDYLEDIYTFEYEFTKPDFEFIDTELEAVLTKLKRHTTDFISLIGKNTWRINNPNINANTVPPEWEIEQPERFREVVREIHDSTYAICVNYDLLIRIGRRKL